MSNPDHLTIRATKKARRLLNILAAHTDEKQYLILERILEKELKELKIKVSTF